jgi:hypothetical protein
MKPPNAVNSYEEYLQVYNLDLPDLTPSELLSAAHRAARSADRFPDAIIWRGTEPISNRRYADERIEICERLKNELLNIAKPDVTKKRRPRGWF